MWEPKPTGPNALLDEPEHLRFLERCAKDVSEYDATVPQRPTPQPKYVTQAELQRTVDGLVQTIAKACKELVVAPLEKRIAELEAREWVGVWQQDKNYPKNSLVSHDGSCWCATRDLPEHKPGTEGSGWRLIVKRGQNGRDAR